MHKTVKPKVKKQNKINPKDSSMEKFFSVNHVKNDPAFERGRFFSWKNFHQEEQEIEESLKEKIENYINRAKIFFKDHLHLVAKSAAENHLRIHNSRTETDLEFRSYTHLKQYQRKVRITLGSTFSMILIIVAMTAFQFFGLASKGATYGWNQNDWSENADTNNFPNHASNQTGWKKYYSKDSIDAGTSLKLERTSQN